MKRMWMKMALAAVAVHVAMASGAQADSTIKIGVNEPLTGAVAASGNFVTDGAKIAADEINAKGGINGRKIELVVQDNKSNPTEAANAAEKLIVQDKVPVLMGAWGSTYTLAVMPKLMEYQVPMLVETSSSDKITVAGNPYVFRISPTNGMEATAFVRYIASLKIRKADFLVVNNDWGLGAAAAFKSVLKQHGVAIGNVLTMDASAQDMSAQLSSLKASDSDTLFITTDVAQLTLLLKQAQDLGLKRQIITTGGSQNPDELVAQAGTAANGTMHSVMFAQWFPEKSADPAAVKYFVDEWKKRGFDPYGMTEGSRGYDGIRTIVAAISKAGTADPDKIRGALWQTQLAGLTGPIAFSKVGPQGKESGQSTPSTYLVKIENGKIVLVK